MIALILFVSLWIVGIGFCAWIMGDGEDTPDT
jgi:hypothetical protein